MAAMRSKAVVITSSAPPEGGNLALGYAKEKRRQNDREIRTLVCYGVINHSNRIESKIRSDGLVVMIPDPKMALQT